MFQPLVAPDRGQRPGIVLLGVLLSVQSQTLERDSHEMIAADPLKPLVLRIVLAVLLAEHSESVEVFAHEELYRTLLLEQACFVFFASDE